MKRKKCAIIGIKCDQPAIASINWGHHITHYCAQHYDEVIAALRKMNFSHELKLNGVR